MKISAFEVYYPVRRSVIYNFFLEDALEGKTEYCSTVHGKVPIIGGQLLRAVPNTLFVFEGAQHRVTALRFIAEKEGEGTHIQIVACDERSDAVDAWTEYLNSFYENLPAHQKTAANRRKNIAIGQPKQATHIRGHDMQHPPKPTSDE